MKKLLFGALAFFSLIGAPCAAPSSAISQDVAVCDPYNPTSCIGLTKGGLGSPTNPINVGEINPPVGSAAVATSQASPGTSATLIVAARTGVPGTGRIAVVITNMGTTPVFIGNSGVTTSTGGYLAGVVGAVKVISTQAALYGITSTGTASVSVEEMY